MQPGPGTRQAGALTADVLADGGLRRSEAAALTWGDVELWADDTVRLTIQKGKNQPEPQTVAVTAATSPALREIRPEDADPATPVFGLSGEALANRVRAAARAAGLGDGFTGHSGRDRDGPEDGGGGSAQRRGAAPGPVEAWRHGGTLHPGRGRRRGTEVADLSQPEADDPAEAIMTDSVRSVCDGLAPVTPRAVPASLARLRLPA